MKDKGKHYSIFINDNEVKYYPEAENIPGFFGIDEEDFIKYFESLSLNGKTPCALALEIIRERPDIALMFVAAHTHEFLNINQGNYESI